MGLMDRVKAQATQLAQQAMESAQEGKARLDQAQANRRGDAMLRLLGALVLAERTGRGAQDSQEKIEQLVADIAAYERESGLDLTAERPVTFSGMGPGPFQTGPAPFQRTGGQAGYQDPRGDAPFAGQGEAADVGPTTINKGPFFTAQGSDEDSGAGPESG